MDSKLQIVWRDIQPDKALDEAIREHTAKLEKRFERITHTRVTVSLPHKHQKEGRIFDFNIDVSIPGHEIVVSHNGNGSSAADEPGIALRNAFDAAQRKLNDYLEKRRDSQR